MRLITAFSLVLLLVMLPVSAPRAAVAVNANINGSGVNCANANSIGYELAGNVFRFTCADDGVTRTCNPTQSISYSLGAGSISVTCNNGAEQGLVVDARRSNGNQFGNGNNGTCPAATAFNFDFAEGGFKWDCGNNQNLKCAPTAVASYDLVNTKITLNCADDALAPFIYGDGFED